MRKKLFISNLDFEITTDELREMFAAAAPTLSVVIATDRETKRSKGFAFVEMESEEAAKAAITALNGKVVNGRPMKVVEDRGKGAPAPGAPGAVGTEGEARRYEPLPPIQRMQLFKRRRKLDPFLEDPSKKIDYRDVATLSRLVSEVVFCHDV
jgi:RNA recognition motif-containing protein